MRAVEKNQVGDGLRQHRRGRQQTAGSSNRARARLLERRQSPGTPCRHPDRSSLPQLRASMQAVCRSLQAPSVYSVRKSLLTDRPSADSSSRRRGEAAWGPARRDRGLLLRPLDRTAGGFSPPYWGNGRSAPWARLAHGRRRNRARELRRRGVSGRRPGPSRARRYVGTGTLQHDPFQLKRLPLPGSVWPRPHSSPRNPIRAPTATGSAWSERRETVPGSPVSSQARKPKRALPDARCHDEDRM